jgi:enoyl-CoA hydratase/carnithine racemase
LLFARVRSADYHRATAAAIGFVRRTEPDPEDRTLALARRLLRDQHPARPPNEIRRTREIQPHHDHQRA